MHPIKGLASAIGCSEIFSEIKKNLGVEKFRTMKLNDSVSYFGRNSANRLTIARGTGPTKTSQLARSSLDVRLDGQNHMIAQGSTRGEDVWYVIRKQDIYEPNVTLASRVVLCYFSLKLTILC